MHQTTLNLKKAQALSLLTLIGFLLNGCDSLRHTFGLDHNRIDEFSVANTRPLEMPPQFDLAPPRPGAKDLKEESATEKAQRKLGTPVKDSAPSPSEEALSKKVLEKGKIDPEIRSKVEVIQEESGSFFDRLARLPQQAKDNLSGKTNPRPTPHNPASVNQGPNTLHKQIAQRSFDDTQRQSTPNSIKPGHFFEHYKQRQLGLQGFRF